MKKHQLAYCFSISVIFVLAVFLRMWHLGSLPVILNRDEAALGYNALLLIETGRDEWGNSWPLALKSFGDFKLLGYPLLLSFLLRIQSSDFVVRLPSAFAGLGLVWLTYLLSKKLFTDKRVVLFITLVSACMPVFVFYSRIAYEANVALSYIVALLCVVLASDNKTNHFIRLISTAGLALASLFTYNTPLVTLPVIAAAVFAATRMSNWVKQLPLVVSIILPVAIAVLVLTPITAAKKNILLFTDPTIRHEFIEYRSKYSGLSLKLFANQYVYYGKLVVDRYIQTFSPNFLVLHGGSHPWHVLPGFGHVYWISYLLFLLGLLVLAKAALAKQAVFSLPRFWLTLALLSPLPAVLTVDAPHATRSLLFFFTMLVVGGYGLQRLSEILKNNNAKLLPIVYVTLIALLSFEAVNYYSQYFITYPSQQHDFRPGLNNLVKNDASTTNQSQILVVDPSGYDYILAAWYTRMPSDEFFATINRNTPDLMGLYYVTTVGKFRFSVTADDRKPEELVVFSFNDMTKQWEASN